MKEQQHRCSYRFRNKRLNCVFTVLVAVVRILGLVEALANLWSRHI